MDTQPLQISNPGGWSDHFVFSFLNTFYLLPIFLVFDIFTDFDINFIFFDVNLFSLLIVVSVLALLNYDFRTSQSFVFLLKFALVILLGFYVASIMFIFVRNDHEMILGILPGLLILVWTTLNVGKIKSHEIRAIKFDLYTFGSLIFTIIILIFQLIAIFFSYFFGFYGGFS